MKILLLSADNLYLVPYKELYLSICKKNNIEYDILFWDKSNNEVINGNNIKRFSPTGRSKLKRIIHYFRFRKIIKNQIRSEKYDYIIGLHPIINLLIFNILITKFRFRYIYDIRDYSFEYLFFVKWIEKFLCKYSKINIISSEGYKCFLPKAKYEIIHNLPPYIDKKYKQINPSVNQKVIISYIGLIRFMEQNCRIIDFFANDNRFLIKFVGTNAEDLKKYCIKNNIHNVFCVGTFPQEKTLEFYENTDLIMNLYGNNTPLLDYALSNKLYYAASLYKPILVSEGTFMEKVSHQYGFGFTLKMEKEEEKDELYNYIKNLNRDELISNCEEFMKKVNYEQVKTVEKLENILRKEQ